LAGKLVEVPGQSAAVFDSYAAALAGSPLEGGSPRAYASRVRSYLTWLASAGITDPDPLADPRGRDTAVRGYRDHLAGAKRAVSTVNAHLTAVNDFYVHLGVAAVQVRRDQPPRRAPRTLTDSELERYLAEVGARPLSRDRAMGRLLAYSGLQVSELTALDEDDVPLSDGKGTVVVRGGASRAIPLLDPATLASVAGWKAERATWPGADANPALFLNRRGGRLSPRAVGQLVEDLAVNAGLADGDGHPVASASTIRNTFGASLLRRGTDVATVAELMGHRALDTTRLLAPPAEVDLEDAVARLSAGQ
jgi:site-specific recombinase XerD